MKKEAISTFINNGIEFFDLEKHLAHQVMIIDDYEKKLANFRDQLKESEEQKQQLQRNIDVMAQQYALLRMNVNCQT
jgi:phage shock protein A